MILFFIIALVAAYTSRNMVFEQRTSANQYRSTQAFEAAEAGAQLALAMLNGGRVDAACRASTDLTNSTFRARYIDTIAADSNITIKTRSTGTPPTLMPVCIFDAASGEWICNCPSDAAPVLPTVGASSARPMFRIKFDYIQGSGTRRDAVRIVSVGCSRPDSSCIQDTTTAPGGDAMSVVTMLVTLKSGLPTLPSAAVVARGNVAGGGMLAVTNIDPGTSGMTVMAGGTINGVQPTTLTGSPVSLSLTRDDQSLSPPAMSSGDQMFTAFFGMGSALYVTQPGLVRLNCATACTASSVNADAAKNPGRVLWLDGDLLVDGNMGAAPGSGGLLSAEVPFASPLLLIVTGQVTLNTGTVYGVIYSRAAAWDIGAGAAVVRGALIAESDLTGSGSQSVTYDPAVVNWMRTRIGTFVRVPGGWKDFTDAP